MNFSVLALVALTPVIAVAARSRWRFAALAGYAWGVGWSLFAFRFLREIDPVIPFLMPWVISLWPACWAACLPFLWRNTLFPLAVELDGYEARKRFLTGPAAFGRLVLFAFGAAALYTLFEWTRSRLFPWNDLSVTMWRNIPLLQIASVTGHYGIMFVPAFFGAALAGAALTRLPARRSQAAAARGGALRSAARGRTAALHAPCEDGGAELVPGPAAGRHLPAGGTRRRRGG